MNKKLTHLHIDEKCYECNCNISFITKSISIQKYNISLCPKHIKWVDYLNTVSTEQTIRLYFALKKRNIPVEIEKFDGYKHIDIAIPKAKINIEVDGQHHNYSKKQALSDLKRTYHSFLRGYHTIRIPNSLTYDNDILEETATYLADMIYSELNKRGY